ncbi:hypothetical protein ACFSUM_08820 [Virgibacillus siamensis]|uniref:hypothetical protein n=1 Tax=Virgibacillus siamensis TaxID=480071 RepID=UPI0031D242A8
MLKRAISQKKYGLIESQEYQPHRPNINRKQGNINHTGQTSTASKETSTAQAKHQP